MDPVIAIAANEPTAPVVEGVAELPHARDGFPRVLQQIEAEIPPVDVDRLGSVPPAPPHLSAAQTVGDVNPVVDAEVRMADPQLRILHGEPLVERFAPIRAAGPFAVLEEEDVRRRRHQQPALPRQHAIGKQQVDPRRRRCFDSVRCRRGPPAA